MITLRHNPMKRTLDLSFDLRDLNGELTDPPTAGKWLAKMLITSASGDAIKFLDWAITLNGGKPVELDDSDFNVLRDFVKGHATTPNLVKANILKAMIAAENPQPGSLAPYPNAA